MQLPKSGEEVCGDDWDWRLRDDRLTVMVADGLGHGSAAHDASREAIATFQREHELSPARVIEDVHGALRATRGAAVAMIAVDLDRGVARYAGVGNIAAVIINANGTRQSLISQNGTARSADPAHPGIQLPRRRPRHADHVFGWSRHSLGHCHVPGSSPAEHPSIIAAVLYRDFSRKRDDVTVVVAQRATRPETDVTMSTFRKTVAKFPSGHDAPC